MGIFSKKAASGTARSGQDGAWSGGATPAGTTRDAPKSEATASAAQPNPMQPVHADSAQPAPAPVKPPFKRFLLRLVNLISGVGAIGFLAGATPYSGQDAPFTSKSELYVLYAVAGLAILVAGFYLLQWCVRRCSPSRPKQNRFTMILLDTVIAAGFGVVFIWLIINYSCKPGSDNHWCDFYNTSIFFCVLGCVSFAVAALWDIFGVCCCCCKKKPEVEQV